MPILAEYGLVPDVFDSTCYTSAELCGVHLQNLKEALLSDGLVRNLRKGEWLQVFEENGRAWHGKGKELLRKLATQNRLRSFPPCHPTAPSDDVEWCHESIASHGSLPLNGIVTMDATHSYFLTNPLVTTVARLAGAPWWNSRSPSQRLQRNLSEYRTHLGLVLSCANSIMFIDPHLDPSIPRYAQTADLLCTMASRTPKPLIELHRVCYVGSGPSRQFVDLAEWRQRFDRALTAPLTAAGLAVEVFIWDDFHDRYLISDLVGISVPYGFDTTTATGKTTWTRLGRNERDDVQREFDSASGQHAVRGRFSIP